MREFSLRFEPDAAVSGGYRQDGQVNEAHRRNSGVALYLSNSLSHSARESGGRTPVMGRHSVMLSPDSVSRVTPPTMTTAMTSADESRSQFPTAGGESTGSSAAGRVTVPLEEKKRGSSADAVEETLGQDLESLMNEYGRAATRDG